ncbi:MAG: single-stranded DNA-binding protein [Firmicutes bacterium]|nr:single-stranded DNA-binding protein [Bacillota bacterium]
MEFNPDIIETNRARLSGEVISGPYYSHRTYGETFYELILGVRRSSGYIDEIRVQISERLMKGLELGPGMFIDVSGQVRTYNEDAGGRSRLNIVIFVRELEVPEYADMFTHENEVFLSGHICKPTIRRKSPLGREICDIMLAVNRMYNKSDYIPCIAWGRNAAYTGTLPVGEELTLSGRIQSREYRKRDEDGNFEMRTAYEVSVVKIED